MLHVLALRSGHGLLVGVIGLVLVLSAIVLLPPTSAVIVLAGAFLILALLRWPEIALYFLVLAIPLGSLVPLPIGGANVTAADGLLALALALWLARQIARRDIVLRPASLLLPFIVFILAVGLSVTGALSLQASLKELAKWIEMLLIYWLIVQEEGEAEPTERDVRIYRLLAVILVAGLIQALIGFYQYLLNVGPAGFSFLGGNVRAFGTFEQPNPYAGYLGLIIPLAFGIILGGLTLNKESLTLPRLGLLALAAVSFGTMVAALFFSLSRGAWLGAAAALVMVAVIRSKRAAVLALSVGLLVALVGLLGQYNVIPDFVTQRFAGVGDYFGLQDVRGVKVTDENFALVERMAHWQAGLDMFQAHPWLGVGFGNYAAVYPAYALPHWDDPLGHAHNYYINVAAESGIIGLAGYLFIWGAIFWLAWRAVRSTRGLAQGIVAGAFGVLIALSVHNLFDNLFVHSMQMQVGMTLGLVESLARADLPRASRPVQGDIR